MTATSHDEPATLQSKAWQFISDGIITETLRLNSISLSSQPGFLRHSLDMLPSFLRPYPGIIIRVAAMALNPVDYKMIAPGGTWNFIIHKPGIPGSDFSGVIVGWLGKKDQWSIDAGLQVGSRVYGHLATEWRMLQGTGTLAEYIIAYPPMILPLPPQISFEQGSSVFLAGMTSWQALVKAGKLKAGQRIFVHGGSGGTGVWGILIAKAMGAYVVSTCSTSSRKLLESIHVDELVDYQSNSLLPYLSKHYSSPSLQFDIIYDCIGSEPNLFSASPTFLRPNGRFIDITSLANSKGFSEHVHDVSTLAGNLVLPTIFGGTPRHYIPVVLRPKAQGFKELDSLIRAGKITPVLDSIHSFETAPAALERLMSERAKGKIVIRVSEELCRSGTPSSLSS